jgi:hypothetical protein
LKSHCRTETTRCLSSKHARRWRQGGASSKQEPQLSGLFRSPS